MSSHFLTSSQVDPLDLLLNIGTASEVLDNPVMHNRRSNNKTAELGQSDEFLPYKRQRRRPTGQRQHSSEVRKPKKQIVKDHEKLLITKRVLEHFNLGDILHIKRIIREWLSDDCEIILLPLSVKFSNKESVCTTLDAFYASFPDGVFLLSDTTVIEGGRVRTRFSFTGVQALDFSMSILFDILAKGSISKLEIGDIPTDLPLRSAQEMDSIASLTSYPVKDSSNKPPVISTTHFTSKGSESFSNLDRLAALVCAQYDLGVAQTMTASSSFKVLGQPCSVQPPSLTNRQFPYASSATLLPSQKQQHHLPPHPAPTVPIPVPATVSPGPVLPIRVSVPVHSSASSDYTGTSDNDNNHYDEGEGDEDQYDDEETAAVGEETEMKLPLLLSSHSLIVSKPATTKVVGIIEIVLSPTFAISKVMINWKAMS